MNVFAKCVAAVLLLAAAASAQWTATRPGPFVAADDETQDPQSFDPVFPRIERELHRDQKSIQLYTVDRVRTLSEGTRSPLAVLAEDLTTRIEILEAVAARPGVRSLIVAGKHALPPETWQRIASMQDLETLSICCDVQANDLRELRHAPKLRMVSFGKVRYQVTDEVIAALLELPHVDAVQFIWQKLPSSAIAKLAGLPHLRMLYLESCTLEPGWLVALGKLRTLRWMSVHFGPYKKGFLSTEDVQRFADIPQLESLRLSNVQLDATALEALPESLQVLDLYDRVPAATLRKLLNRPQLRGLTLGSLDSGAEEVLCERLLSTKLERFGCYRKPTEKLWQVLGQLPRLRHLKVRTGTDFSATVDKIVALRRLEHIELFVGAVPSPDQLLPLRDLSSLCRVSITDIGGDGSIAHADVPGLRRILGPDVDVTVR